jgi:hypothetical protein
MHEKNHARGKMSIGENAAVKSVWLWMELLQLLLG